MNQFTSSADLSIPNEDTASMLISLEVGTTFRFSSWPISQVPKVCAGTYTIWKSDKLIYVGMSGRSLTERAILEHREGNSKKGLFSRLNSHASGRRSGDQFCVYVADRLVLPTLSQKHVEAIWKGDLNFDKLVRNYIHEHLYFRFVETKDSTMAFHLEKQVRLGLLKAGKPLLNPL